MYSDHNGIKLEINYDNKRNSGEFTSMCKLSNTCLTNQVIKEVI